MLKRLAVTILTVLITLLPWPEMIAQLCDLTVTDGGMACCTAEGSCSMAEMSDNGTLPSAPQFCECEDRNLPLPAALPAKSADLAGLGPVVAGSPLALLPSAANSASLAQSPRLAPRDRSGTWLQLHTFRI
jgi:hypothetical protein